MSESKKYIEMLARAHREFGNGTPYWHEWMIANGQAWGERDDTVSLKLRRAHKFRNNQCYYNCQSIALQYTGEYDYAEGIGRSVIPMDHAWLIDRKTGKVLDPTWMDGRQDSGTYPVDYFGMIVPAEIIRRFWNETETAGPVLSFYYDLKEEGVMTNEK